MPPLLSTNNINDSSSCSDRKSVRFQDLTAVQEFPIVQDADKASYWMGPADFLQIRREYIHALQVSYNPLKRGKIEFRGLEHKTPTGAQRRVENRAKARRAVLDEQVYQSKMGFKDPEYIAALYSTITHRSRVEANILGIKDEMAAKENTWGLSFRRQTFRI
eukprot:scaffold2322_cov135-Cylindrotheca_fusiformis.AAC.3